MVREGVGESARLFALGMAASVAGHAALLSALRGSADEQRSPRAPMAVRFEVAKPRVLPEPPLPPKEPTRPPDPKPRPSKAPRPVASSPVPEPAPADTSQETSEVTGVTLTAPGDAAGWAANAGNGEARDAPLRAAAMRPPRPVERALPRRDPPPPPAVPANSLSKRPVPPALDALLANHYPAAARRRGLEGEAVVRVRIDADGRVRSASVVSETTAGFGGACRKTLVGSRWSTPIDRNGAAVATHARYRCRFRIDD